jgi:putative transposase
VKSRRSRDERREAPDERPSTLDPFQPANPHRPVHWRDRLVRPRAYNDPGHAHELTFSCFKRFPFLSKDRPCEWLADSIRAAKAEFDYALWAYVFMPDHVHLVVWPRQKEYDDSDFLGRIKEPVSRRAVAALRREAPHWLPRIAVPRGERTEHHLWQPGRGHDRNVVSGRTLLAMIDYIHLNPVRRGLVERAADWKWSSAGWFEGAPKNDLNPDPIPPEWLYERV